MRCEHCIALRDDSAKFKDGELLMWSSNGNKIVSTGLLFKDLQTQIKNQIDEAVNKVISEALGGSY